MLKDAVFFTQTDTTLGFISQNHHKLNSIKKRPPQKHYIKAVNSLKTLQSFVRVPSKHKKHLRRTTKSTFIFPNGHSYRLIQDNQHLLLLNRLTWAYTTSANLSGHDFNETFAKTHADVSIEPLSIKQKASSIYKLSSTHKKRIR